MKKRALSLLLAFALCFTMFTGVTTAASVEGAISRVSGILDSATEGQRAILEKVVAKDEVAAPSLEQEAWKNFTDVIFTDTIFMEPTKEDDHKTVFPWFVLKYYAQDGMDLSDKPFIQTAVDELKAADEQYNTAGKSINASIDMFDGYHTALETVFNAVKGIHLGQELQEEGIINNDVRGYTFNDQYYENTPEGDDALEEAIKQYIEDNYLDQITDEVTEANPDADADQLQAFIQERIDELETLITNHPEDHGITVDGSVSFNFESEKSKEILAFSKEKGLEAIKSVLDIAAATTGDELKAAYDAFENNDEAKKIGALLLGIDLVKRLTSSDMKTAVKDFAKAHKNEIMDKINAEKGNVLVADSVAAVTAARQAAQDYANMLLESAQDTIITEVKTDLENLGIDAAGAIAASADLAEALDNSETDKHGFEAVWMDLALAYVLNPYISSQGNTPVSKLQLVKDGNGAATTLVDFSAYHNKLHEEFGIDTRINLSENLEIVAEDGVELVFDEEANGYQIKLAEMPKEEKTVAFKVYRGKGTDDLDDYRYIKDITITLVPAEVEPPVDEREITITSPTEGQEIAVGTDFTIKGTQKNFTNINIAIEDAEGKVVYYDTVTAEQYVNGITVKLDKIGDYKLTAGENGKIATVNFKVVAKEDAPTITLSAPTGQDVKPGETVKVVGTATNMDVLQIAVMAPDGTTKTFFDSVTAERLKNGVEITVGNVPSEAFPEYGTYTVIAGQNGCTATATFVVVKPEDERFIDLTSPNGERYRPGQDVLIKGDTNLTEVQIAVTSPTGSATEYVTVTAEEFKKGHVLTVGEIGSEAFPQEGEYTVIAGQDGCTDTANFFVVSRLVQLDEIVPHYYLRGETVTVKGTSYGFQELIVAIEKPVDTDADYDSAHYYYATITPEQLENGFEINVAEDATLGEYKVIVGENGYTDEKTFEVVERIFVKEATLSSMTKNVGTSYESLNLSKDRKTITLTDTKGKTYNAEITWGDETKAEYDAVKSTAGTYTLHGTYSVPANTGYIAPVDLIAELNITLTSGGGGHHGGTTGGDKDDDKPDKVTTDIFEKKLHNAYMQGYGDGTVRPEANITREEVTTILYRLLTEDAHKKYDTASTNRFPDVESGRWSMGSVATLNNIGIINGYEDGTFRPANQITRAEFAALLARLAEVKTAADTKAVNYTDIDGHWGADAIKTVTAQGWFEGDPDGKFRPDDKITRAEAATVMNRVLGRDNVDATTFSRVELVEFDDLDKNDWYYEDMVEATNSHDYSKSTVTGVELWEKKAD